MIFNKPINLNGEELRQELKAAEIEISNNRNAVVVRGEELFLDIKPADYEKAKKIVADHNGNIIPKEATIEDKLSSVGLSLPDLKTALGL